MSDDESKPYGGSYGEVLDHPEHTAGVAYATLTVGETRRTGGMIRVRGVVDHGDSTEAWTATNLAIRLEIPGLPGDDDVVSRVYTIRSGTPVAEGSVEVEFDVVVHDGESPMMSWVHGVRPGDRARILGPRQHFLPPHVEGRPVALFADETGIPALATIIRDWPAGSRGFAWVESPEESMVRDIPDRPEVDVVWLRREPDREPGTTGNLVRAALDSLTTTGSVPTVWAAGEKEEMRGVRKYFRSDLDLPKDDVQVFGYWRRHQSSSELDRIRLERYQRELERTGEFTVLDEFEDTDPAS